MGGAAALAPLALAGLLLTSGCAAAVPGLWPPAPGQPGQRVVVSLDTWHAVIAFPLAPAGGSPAPGAPAFEEWGYAERAWYLEGRQSVSGALRALLWPSEGMVEVTRSDRIWAERTPQPPAEVFAFELSEAGHAALRRYLEESLEAPEPFAVAGPSRFFSARRPYHLLHQCHQWAGGALRAAGLPLVPALALSRGLFAAQLRRAARMGEEAAGRPAAPPEGTR